MILHLSLVYKTVLYVFIICVLGLDGVEPLLYSNSYYGQDHLE